MAQTSIFHSTLFRKILVAATGIVMIGFVLVHMIGNLQVFAGAGPTVELTKINAYGALLKKNLIILWGARIFLLASVFLHVVMTVSLVRRNKKARPVAYAKRSSYASAASKMMFYGGITLFLYIIYHILHFTTGSVHTSLYVAHDVYGNLVRSFQKPLISFIYIIAQVALFGHLYHGTVSVFQTLGFSNPKHLRVIKKAGIGLSLIICLGFISIPVSILAGWVN